MLKPGDLVEYSLANKVAIGIVMNILYNSGSYKEDICIIYWQAYEDIMHECQLAKFLKKINL